MELEGIDSIISILNAKDLPKHDKKPHPHPEKKQLPSETP